METLEGRGKREQRDEREVDGKSDFEASHHRPPKVTRPAADTSYEHCRRKRGVT
jgi:hypothetical protein